MKPTPVKREWNIAEIIYEACRLEAEWSKRSIVPEKFTDRDLKFKKQFYDIIGKYISQDKLPTPKQVHDSWVEAYKKMGWKYGEKRDTTKKTHPDILPFEKLPKDEKDKDAIFLIAVWIAREILSFIHSIEQSAIEDTEEKYKGQTKRIWYQKGYQDALKKDLLAHQDTPEKAVSSSSEYTRGLFKIKKEAERMKKMDIGTPVNLEAFRIKTENDGYNQALLNLISFINKEMEK